MDARATPFDHDAMLAHAGWLRALAASLVNDSATADDLVQDTLVAALEHPPRPGWKVEPWLARVLQNFAFRRRRDELRRAEQEAAAATSSEASAPDSTVETLDLQATIVEAVRAIDEPFRTTIVMRYFEGRSCADIARRERIPAGTVRWRLKRGLDELRERLDTRFDGSRATWLGLLVPLATRELVPGGGLATHSVWKGAWMMNVTQATLTATAVVTVASVVWWSLAEPQVSEHEPIAAIAAEPVRTLPTEATAPSLEASPTAEKTERESVSSPVASAELTPAATPTEPRYTSSVDARFVDERGLPKAGVRFAVCDDEYVTTGVMPAWSGPDGRAQLDVPIPRIPALRRGGDSSELIREWRFRFTASSSGCATVECAATLRDGEVAHLGDVVLGPGARVHGRVVDENGRALAGASVGVAAAELSDDDNRMRRLGSSAFRDASTATSSESGAFVLDGVALGTCRLWSHADGKRFSWSDPITVAAGRDVFDVELVLTPMLATDRIEGRVVDPDGEPVPNAGLFYTARTASSSTSTGLRADESGRFVLVIEYDGSTYDFTAQDPKLRFAQASVFAVVPGTLDLVLELGGKRFLDVRVVDSDGKAIDGVAFNVSSRMYERQAIAEPTGDGRHHVEIPDDVMELSASAPGWRTERRGPFDPSSLPNALEIEMRRAPTVRGRVVADGRAIAGAHVEARTDDDDSSLTVNGFRCVMSSWSSGKATTDEQGRFELVCDLDGALWIRATADGWVAGERGPIDSARLDESASFDVELTLGGAIEGHVLLAGGLDAEGTVVAINHGDGLPRTMRAGANGHFRFEGLVPGRWQVMSRKTEIDPGSTHYGSSKEADPIEWNCEVRAGKTTRYDLDLSTK